MLVEQISGTSFAFESRAGYLSSDHHLLIAPACAGVNCLLAAFLMLAVRKLLREHALAKIWRYFPVAALLAYLVTLIANTVRIAIALQLRKLPENSWLDHEQLHRIEGIIVYSGFLLLLFIVSEKMSAAKPTKLARHLVFPLLIYYAVTIGMPLVNGGYRQGTTFWEHSAFVVVIPLLLLLPVALFCWQWKRVNTVSDTNAEV
jgi:exosortase K